MDRYEVMAGKMAPLTDGAHRKWGFTGKVETRSYERLVDALIDFVETGDSLKARFLTGFAACLAADRKSVENRGFGVAVRKVQCHRGEDGTVRVSSVETMLGCIDYIASVAYHGGILLKPITTEKEITGHIGDTILSWCEKGQKDDGGNEFRD